MSPFRNPAAGITQEALDIEKAEHNLDPEEVHRRVREVLSDKLYWFPVRHHSPAVAQFLEKAIEERKPKVIFIEGPHESNHLLHHLLDPATRPPVAVYSSYRDDNNVLGLAGVCSPAEHIPARFACWYPMLSYSPEYVAIQVAARIKAETVFMDLPYHSQIVPFAERVRGRMNQDPLSGLFPFPDASASGQPAGRVAETADGSDEDDADGEHKDDRTAPATYVQAQNIDQDRLTPSATDTEGPDGERSGPSQPEDDRLLAESSFYKTLAEVAGFRSWDEAWDSLFETRRFKDVEEFRVEMATFCAAARATSAPDRVANDGTLERERFMMQTIRETLAAKKIAPEEAMVVCGGFHLFLDANDTTPPPAAPEGTVYSTIVPYSYFRLSEMSGYASGNRAPHYYQTLWEFARAGKLSASLIEHVVTILKQARKTGEPVSSADAIAICHHAEMLARLRGREQAVLDDIHDAVITCCCKGKPEEDGQRLWQAIESADIGNKIGRVTSALGQLPIVNDFYAQIDQMQLGEVLSKEKRLNLELDKRQELGNRQSILLHRLRYLKVPLGVLLEESGNEFGTGGLLFRERWRLVWSPEVESTLIELNLYGDTIEGAALSRLREELASDENHAGRTCQRLVSAINMDLPNLVHEAEDACSKAIDADTRFVSLTQALNGLMLLDRYAIYRNLRRDILEDITLRCFNRACFAILDVISVPEEQQSEVVGSLLALAEALQRDRDNTLDKDLFVQHVRHASTATTVPFLRGVFLGMLAELREMPAENLAAEISALARAPVEMMVTAGDLLDGIMSVSRTSIMLGADALVASIDELLRAAEWECFLTMLPRVRAAIERLHDRQRDSLAEKVAQSYGLKDTESLTELRTSVAAAAKIAEIDQRVAEIMKRWEF